MKKFKKSLIVICCLSGFSATGLPSYSSGGVFMKEKICGIYKITSPSKKIYIGQSRDIEKRRMAYKSLGCKNQPLLYNSLKKYGWAAHAFEVIHVCDECDLNKLEKYYVDLYNTFNSNYGMNLKDGGGNKVRLSEETKNKIREKAIGRKASEQTKAKMRLSRSNMTAETKQKMSNSKKGIRFTQEHKDKISSAQKGKIITIEQREKISKTLTGRKLEPFSKERKENMAKARRGKKIKRNLSDEQRKRRSKLSTGSNNGMYGRHHSAETRKKMSEARFLHEKRKQNGNSI